MDQIPEIMAERLTREHEDLMPGPPDLARDASPDQIKDWLERSILRGTGRKELARRLGITPDEVPGYLERYVNQQRMNRLFAACQARNTAAILLAAEEILPDLAREYRKCESVKQKIEVVKAMTDLANLKGVDTRSLLEAPSVDPAPEIVERYEILDGLIGQTTPESDRAGEDHPQVGDQ